MGKIYVKKFLLSKTGIVNNGQDAMACNFANGRFAVADGVTNSFHPEFVAQALCDAFMEVSVTIQEWEQQLSSHILNEISDLWAEKVESLTALQTGRQRRHIEINRENLPMGSSTFAGIEFDLAANRLIYRVLGDSSLFLIPQEGDFSIVCSSRREVRGDRQYVIYDNTPACISNFEYNCQGRPRLDFDSQWEEGEFPVVPGYVVLLTDGAAQWLQDALIMDKDAINIFWNMNTEKAFVDFVSEQRVQEKMDDDLAIYILKIDSVSNDGFEEVIMEPYSSNGEENFSENAPMGTSIITKFPVEDEPNLVEEEPTSIEETIPVEDKAMPPGDLLDEQTTSEAEEYVAEEEESNQPECVDEAVSMGTSTITEFAVEDEPNLVEVESISIEEEPTFIEEIIPVEDKTMPTGDLLDEQPTPEAEEYVAEEEESNQPECVDEAASMGTFTEFPVEDEPNFVEVESIPIEEEPTSIEETISVEDKTMPTGDLLDEQPTSEVEKHITEMKESSQIEHAGDTNTVQSENGIMGQDGSKKLSGDVSMPILLKWIIKLKDKFKRK